ncbi:hypothetical protein [Cohnella terricola]|uniref:Uncharacterized protein n=1 Tax=Cohnella terricola TaxID=1289167 RepID=A0A559J4S6_9BACL|nr:hypothetical protein [Cohnella terricola]TVX94895.1 hypothetical protein FPZ45_24605 [Cohnella terricola]
MDINKKEPTEAEYAVLYNAVDDFCEKGNTDIACPRCGKKLVFQGNSTSFIISCEDRGCIELSERGL